MQTGSSSFRALENDVCLAEVMLDAASKPEVLATLSETQRIGFEVEPKEIGLQYRLMIGDLAPVNEIGQAFRRHVEWPSGQYLESARGLVAIHLFSRAEEESSQKWQQRATLPVVVNSSKVTEAGFEAMVEDLTSLSSGLLFDLLSKATAGLRQTQRLARASVSPRSAQLELRLLEELVDDLAVILTTIASQPQTVLRTQRVIAAWTGSERLSGDGLGWLLERGMNPGDAAVGHEMLVPRLHVVTDTKSSEHGVIRWFLELLNQRAAECARRAHAERKSIEADRPHRDRRVSGEPSLFETFDKPKIARLAEASRRAAGVACSVRGMLSLPYLARQRPIAPTSQTPIFRNVPQYHRFWRFMREYLRRTTVMLEHSLDERSKPTWRMYEQWVYLQIAAACEACGLRPSSQESLFRRLGTHLFTVDLRRGTTLGFTGADGRIVLLRYEPWIFSRGLAQRNGDAVFQGGEGEVPWSPDVLIEVFDAPQKGRVAQLAAAFVVDAKYSWRLEERHWEQTSKYQMIRDTETASQIVRQVWVALPGEVHESTTVRCRDESVRWTADGPSRPYSASEFLHAAVSIGPDPAKRRGSVSASAVELIRGTLAWLEFPEGARKGEQPVY